MANHYWIETQRYEWPAALARLMLLFAAAALVVLVAGCHSAPSMGPDVHVTIEQKTSIPDCGQITPATAKPGCTEPAEQQATEDPAKVIAATPPVPLNWNLDLPPAAEPPTSAEAPAVSPSGDAESAEQPSAEKASPARKPHRLGLIKFVCLGLATGTRCDPS